MSCRGCQLTYITTLFLGRRSPPQWLTSTSCIYFCQQLTPVLLKSAEEETKVCGRTGYRTRELWLLSQTRYRLRHATQREQNVKLQAIQPSRMMMKTQRSWQNAQFYRILQLYVLIPAIKYRKNYKYWDI